MIAVYIALGWVLGALWVLCIVRDGAKREDLVRRFHARQRTPSGGTWSW